MNVLVRRMDDEDMEALVELMAQLGYPVGCDVLAQRLAVISGLADYETLVAEVNGAVAGFVGMCKGFAYKANGAYVRVLALVVHDAFRGKGVGERLMVAAEDWGRAQGCVTVTLNSGNRLERVGAHRFYERIGFVARSTGFSKRIE